MARRIVNTFVGDTANLAYSEASTAVYDAAADPTEATPVQSRLKMPAACRRAENPKLENEASGCLIGSIGTRSRCSDQACREGLRHAHSRLVNGFQSPRVGAQRLAHHLERLFRLAQESHRARSPLCSEAISSYCLRKRHGDTIHEVDL